MSYCPRCGERCTADVSICPSCGNCIAGNGADHVRPINAISVQPSYDFNAVYELDPIKKSHKGVIVTAIVAIMLVAAVLVIFTPNSINHNIATVEVEIINNNSSTQAYNVYLDEVWKERMEISPKTTGNTSFKVIWEKDESSCTCKIKVVRETILNPSRTQEVVLKSGETKTVTFTSGR